MAFIDDKAPAVRGFLLHMRSNLDVYCAIMKQEHYKRNLIQQSCGGGKVSLSDSQTAVS